MKSRIITLIPYLLVLFLFVGTGYIFSGYNVIDDHEFFNQLILFKNKGLKTAFLNILNTELNDFYRFRLVYITQRFLLTVIFGNNVWLFYLYRIFLLFGTIFFISKTIDLFIKDKIYTTITILLTITGNAAAALYPLGPAELEGIFFLSASIYFYLNAINKSRPSVNRWLSVFMFLMASLCKETFVLTAPGLVAFYVWHTKIYKKIDLKSAIKSNLYPVVGYLFILFGLLLTIKLFLNPDGLGYAKAEIKSAKMLMVNTLKVLSYNFGLIVLIPALIFFIISEGKTLFKKLINQKNIVLISILILLIFPQIYIYAFSGMHGRYLFPSIFLYNLIITVVISANFEKVHIPKKLKTVTIFFAIILILIPLIKDHKLVTKLTYENKNFTALLNTIKTNAPDTLLVYTDPVEHYEPTISLQRFVAFYSPKTVFAVKYHILPYDSLSEFNRNPGKPFYDYVYKRSTEKLNPHHITVANPKAELFMPKIPAKHTDNILQFPYRQYLFQLKISR